MRLGQAVVSALKTSKIKVTIIDIAQGRVAVNIDGTSRVIYDLRVSGGDVSIGDRVVVEWDGHEPVVYSPAKNAETNSAVVYESTPGGAGGSSGGEFPADAVNAPVIVMSPSGVFGNERTLIGGNALSLVDGGAGESVTLDVVDSEINHDVLLNFAVNEHIDHAGVVLTAGSGLTGGGTIAASRTFAVDQSFNPTWTGDHEFQQPVLLANGAVGTPALAFASDLNTGIYRPAADTLAVSTGGTERMRVDSDGNVGVGTTAPDDRLHVIDTNYQLRLGYNDSSFIRFLVGSSGYTDIYNSGGGIYVKPATGGFYINAPSIENNIYVYDYTGTNKYGRYGSKEMSLWDNGVQDTRFRFGTYGWTGMVSNFGVGINVPLDKLHVSGDVRIDSATFDHGHNAITVDYDVSRGHQLVTNAWGTMGDNTNFLGFTYITTDLVGGQGCFEYVGNSPSSTFSSESIPVDRTKRYNMSGWFKSTGAGGDSRIYAGLSAMDKDGNNITAHNYRHSGDTETTLASALSNGETVVYLTDVTNWDNSTATHDMLGIYDDPFYQTYGSYYYTQNTVAFDIASIDYNNNTITLDAPWSGSTVAAGTNVSQNIRGGGYLYALLSGTYVPDEWTFYTITIEDEVSHLTSDSSKWFPGTTAVKILFLPNYSQGSTYTIQVDGLELAQSSYTVYVRNDEHLILKSVWQNRYGSYDYSRFSIDGKGVMSWGAGTTAVDTALYRSTPGVLRVDHTLLVDDSLTIGYNDPNPMLEIGGSALSSTTRLRLHTGTTAYHDYYGHSDGNMYIYHDGSVLEQLKSGGAYGFYDSSWDAILYMGQTSIQFYQDAVTFTGVTIRSNDWVSGTAGFGIAYTGAADFRSITADELYVEAFIYDVNLALAGSQTITYSLGTVSRAFTVPATTGTLYLYDLPGITGNVFADGDWIKLRYIDHTTGLTVSDVWGTVVGVTAGDEGPDEQAYTWTTQSGTTGWVIAPGIVAFDYGQSGQGYIHSTVLDPAGSPYTDVATWVTDPSVPGNITTHLRSGDLNGLSGIEGEYGLWAGEGFGDTDGQVIVSDSQVTFKNVDLTIHDGTHTVIRLDRSAPYIAVGANAPTGFLAGNGFWVGDDEGTYKFHLGNTSSEIMYWDGASLTLQSSSNNYLKFSGDNMYFATGGVTKLYFWGATGAARFGPGGEENLYFTGSALQMRDAARVAIQLDSTSGLRMFDSSGSAVITLDMSGNADFQGTLTAANGNVVVDNNALQLTQLGYAVQFKDGSDVVGSLYAWETKYWDGSAVNSFTAIDLTSGSGSVAITLTGSWTDVSNGGYITSSGADNVYAYSSTDTMDEYYAEGYSASWSASENDMAEVSLDYKVENLQYTGGDFYIEVEWLNSSSTVLQVDTLISSTDDEAPSTLTAITLRSNRAPANTAYVRLRVYAGSALTLGIIALTVDNIEIDLISVNAGVRVGKQVDTHGLLVANDGLLVPSGEIIQGGTDYGGYEIQTSGQLYVNDYGVFMGGVHVGGASDPGTDNLLVDGDIKVASGLVIGSNSLSPGTGELWFDNVNTKLEKGTGDKLKVSTSYGYVELGAYDASWAHLNTDRSNFYVNKSVAINGGMCVGSTALPGDNNLSVVGSITAGGGIKASLGSIFATTNTSSTYSGQYTKIARVTLPSIYANYTASLSVQATNSSNADNRQAMLYVWIKQQAAFGNDPIIDLRVLNSQKDGITNTWFYYKIVQNTPTTIVDIYARPQYFYTAVGGSVINQDANSFIEWYSNQSYATAVMGSVSAEYLVRPEAHVDYLTVYKTISLNTAGSFVVNLVANGNTTITHNFGTTAVGIHVTNGDYSANGFTVLGVDYVSSNSCTVRTSGGTNGVSARFNVVIFED